MRSGRGLKPKQTLEDRRAAAIAWLDGQGVSAATVCQWLGVIQVDDIDEEEMKSLQGAAKRIQAGESADAVFHVEPQDNAAPPFTEQDQAGDEWVDKATEGV